MYQFGLARTTELEEIFALIDRRIQWMDEVGIRQWNVTDYWGVYPREHYIQQLQQNRLYVLRRITDNTVVGTAVLYETDDRWPDGMFACAYYVHHFASALNEKGVGELLLNHLEDLARAHGKDSLRLDCAGDSPRLNRYYAEKGYVLMGSCTDGVYRGNLREKRFQEK